MGILKKLSLLVLLLVAPSVAVSQQPEGAKEFNKDGVIFNYPKDWNLQDDSDQDFQQMTLTRSENDARIRVLVHRGRTSADKLPQAKTALIDPYLTSTFKQFEQIGAKPQQASASIDIAGEKADGVIIRAMMDEPGAAQIFWRWMNGRVVVLTIFGSDKAIKAASSTWEGVRTSLQIAGVEKQPSK